MRRVLSLTVLLLVCGGSARAGASSDLTVPLPVGETPLGDIGVYRVGYQSYGARPVLMPVSWTGHFTTESGISYVPNQRVLGSSAILLHSPWRVPPGRAWVDYRLRLPRVAPIRLSFGIAMGPDVAVPGRSDGVTFSCSLIVGGRERRLMRHHHSRAEWVRYSFDLSAWRGQTVTVRLQTEPGPQNNPGWDYSYFGDPLLRVGRGTADRAAAALRLANSPAMRLALRAGVAPLTHRNDRSITPSSLVPGRNTISRSGSEFRLVYEGPDCRVVYRYQPETGTLDDFSVQVDEGRPFMPAAGGGVTLVPGASADRELSPVLSGGRARRVSLRRGSLSVLWEYSTGVGPVCVAWRFGIAGKALLVSARCERPVLSALSLGDVGMAPLRRTFAVPYLLGTVHYLPVEGVFACRYLDWTVSHASSCPQGQATYEPRTDGTRNALVETGYVAVSPNVDEVLPNIPHPRSPFLRQLAPRIMLDIWGHHRGTFLGDAENLRNLKDHGVDHLAIISHDWQRYGYDVKLPDHIPANPVYGGDGGMAEFGRTANVCGYLWSLHENYIDLYPNAPSYDPTAVVLRADGSPSPAWLNQVQSFGLKCNRALGYARRNSPEIHRRYRTTAAYLDVHTCVPPWHQLDHEAGQPMAAMALAKVKYDTRLFQYMRDTHGGPLFGEGANHFYWAGRCDGVEAQVAGGEHHEPFLDFDLLKIHPQMVNHGMGYYERWFERGYGHQWGVDTGTMEQVDKYRAQELAYGHAGFIGSAQTSNVQWVAREHHLMHAVQRLYGAARPTEILYEVGGKLVPASVALAAGERLRQCIRYDSGLVVWVNWHPRSWRVRGRVLPQWGFLALGPGTEACTVLQGGRFADLARCPEYVFVDARTSISMPYLHGEKRITPRLRHFEHLGGGRIRLSYEWTVNDTLDEDYHCFVHFTHAESKGGDGIEFQQDHALPRPTTSWRRGDVITDGPYEVQVPAAGFDTYDILIGLFKGARVPLQGIQTPGNRILIGRLKVSREGGQVRDVSLADISAEASRYAVRRADFTARLNPPGTWVDFGVAATNGSAKIQIEKGRLVVFPYPRDRQFQVRLDLRALAPQATRGPLRVRALAARTQADLGPVPCRMRAGRLTLTGRRGAGRYAIVWGRRADVQGPSYREQRRLRKEL